MQLLLGLRPIYPDQCFLNQFIHCLQFISTMYTIITRPETNISQINLFTKYDPLVPARYTIIIRPEINIFQINSFVAYNPSVPCIQLLLGLRPILHKYISRCTNHNNLHSDYSQQHTFKATYNQIIQII